MFSLGIKSVSNSMGYVPLRIQGSHHVESRLTGIFSQSYVPGAALVGCSINSTPTSIITTAMEPVSPQAKTGVGERE